MKLLSKIKSENINRYLTEGFTYAEIMEAVNCSEKPIRRIKKEMADDAIYIKKYHNFYDKRVQIVVERIMELLSIQYVGINNGDKKKITQRDVYVILNKSGVNISFSKTKQLFKYAKNKMKNSYLNLHYYAGEQVEFDYGQIKLNINGFDQWVYLAVYTFPYSNYDFIYVSEKHDGKAFAKSFNAFVKHIGSVPPKVVFDNLKLGVQYHSKKKNRIITKLFENMSEHFGFQPHFCSPYQPNQKGTVENSVKRIKGIIKKYNIARYDDLSQVIEFINDRLSEINDCQHPFKNNTRKELLKNEKPLFLEKPSSKFVFYEYTGRVVQKNLVHFKYAKYEVPSIYNDMQVKVKYNKHQLYIMTQDDTVIAKHIITNKKEKKLRIWYHCKTLYHKNYDFEATEEYRQLKGWLKKIYHNAFESDIKAFSLFIRLLRGQPKNIIKKYKHKNNLEYETLTKEGLLKLIAQTSNIKKNH
jgi:hypothetical protein